MIERGLTADIIKASICGLTEAVHTNQGFEVTLPQMYHNGQSVVVMIRPDDGGFIVHDNSYAAMLLSNLGFAVGKRLGDALAPQVASYGCDLTELRVWRRCETLEDIGAILALVGCASRLIADQALKADRPPLHDFKSSLLSKVVSAVGVQRVRTNEEVSGHLGSRYRVSTVVLDRAQHKPIAFVEPITDRDAIARRFKQFYDLSLNPNYEQIERIAVYDEATPMPSGDALLIEEVGNLVRFADTTQRFRSWATVQ
ncbi:hypothetical protein [Sphingobium phenoxybenzoativorans]|uniref:hypothetical protein n=1 Tax=Sphingobium phenoxybenzoativorans TaxID=1592790 RepID=UPI000872A6CF|nr:hypothetical protein [Sphingobium phenoxybenzoativorans]